MKPRRSVRWAALCLTALTCLTPAGAQETRSTIAGHVMDPQGAAIMGASVTVHNVETNTVSALKTNQVGYYEATLLLPGNYHVSVEAEGFKKALRQGIILQVGSRAEIDFRLEVGALTESVSVTAEAPLLDTTTATSGRVLDNRTLMDLPVLGNSVTLLVKLAPGIQTGGVNNYLGLHSNVGGSDYNTGGNVGGNEWSIDGVPNNGNSRRAAYLPYSDTVQEFKVETSNFDASIGHTTGATVSMITKSGTNDYHGTLTEQHWQQRWNGTPFFVKKQYYENIARAEARGDTALANQLRNTDKQPSGRSNNWATTIGGPVRIPWLYNGKDKLFFFFSYNGFKDVKPEDANSINRTVPTVAERNGDFSQFLNIVNNTRYIIYDPLSVRPDPARPGQFIRDPFNGNIIPRNRFQNPAYNHYVKFYPLPNNPQPANLEQRNNYLAVATPYNWDYKAFSNRVDYGLNEKHRFFGRWSWNDFLEDRGDWTYETARGLHTNGLNRRNAGATVDWVWTKSSTTIFDFAVAANQFREGDKITVPLQFKPSDVGFPSYIDQKAGDQHILPFMDFDAYQDLGRGGIPTFTRYRMLTGKADVTHIRGNHTWRGGLDNRHHFRTGGGGGNTSGNYRWTNTFTRRTSDNGVQPATDIAHAWAAFILGFPSGMSISTNDSYALHNPYYAGYLQDNWRITPKLSLNFGFRLEYELGPTERYNRNIGAFDPTLKLPISDIAQAAYARNPIAQLDPAAFQVRGGSVYLPSAVTGRAAWAPQLMAMPRFAFAYQLDRNTVIRGGYGMFYDTLNVLNQGLSQTNFSRGTGANITNDSGVTWRIGDPFNGRPPITDPFPIRADGTRYDVPTRDALGSMAVAGRSFTWDDFNSQRARQQRWRLGIQRQLGAHMVVEAAYAGNYSDNVYIDRHFNALPGQYWADGKVRNQVVNDTMNQNVPNPFTLGNFSSLQSSMPLVYQDMSTQGFFTGSIMARNRLLRPFPHMGTDLIRNNGPYGFVQGDSLEVSLNRRFAQGFNLNFGYTAMNLREADFYWNQFDTEPTWRQSNDGRPHRIVASGIYELPFGRGRSFVNSGWLSHFVGGWQIALTYEYQPGPLLDWGNVFYYGDIADINTGTRTFDRWFNVDAPFERDPNKGPASFHKRQFPTRIDGLRRDMTNQWNGNVQRTFKLRERTSLELRMDALNLANRSQMNAPDTGPFSTNFGRITSQTAATNRFIQIQGRIRF